MLYAIVATYFGKTCRIVTEREAKLNYILNQIDPGSQTIKCCQAAEEAYAFAYDFTDEQRQAIFNGDDYNYFEIAHTFTDAEDIMHGAMFFRVPLDDTLRSTLSLFIDDVHTPADYPADELYELDKSVVEMNSGETALRHAQEWETRRQHILTTSEAVKHIAGNKFDPFNDYGKNLIELAHLTLLDKLA